MAREGWEIIFGKVTKWFEVKNSCFKTGIDVPDFCKFFK